MRLRLGLWAGGVALLALASGWALAQATYEPLVHGTGATAFGVRAPGGGFLADGEPFAVDRLVEDPPVGTRVGLLLGLANDGRFDVEVLDVGLPFPDTYLDDRQPFASDAPGGSGLPHVPLEPFVLRAGGNRDVGVVFRVAGCSAGAAARNGGALVAREVPVTWRWLGRTRTTLVPLRDLRPTVAGLPVCAAP